MSHAAPISPRRARGLMLGLVLGDALGAISGEVPTGSSPLRAAVGGQLACTTVEGTIRSHVRLRSKGISHTPSVVWHAVVRWARHQGIDALEAYKVWDHGQTAWPDGFLSQVPVLGERRGSAPATVSAVRVPGTGSRENPKTTSAGYHGLVRTLPVALLGPASPELHELAAGIAALTHGSPAGWLPAADAVLFLAATLRVGDLKFSLSEGAAEILRTDSGHLHVLKYRQRVSAGIGATFNAPDPRHVSKGRTALAALGDALYVVAAFPERHQVQDALAFAAQHSTVAATATVGALLGACHGPDAFPTELLSRLELAWVAEVLAQDLVRELVEPPRDDAVRRPGTINWDDSIPDEWWARYPGW